MIGCRISVVRSNALTGARCGDTVYQDDKCEFHFLLDNGRANRLKRNSREYTIAFTNLAVAAKKQMDEKLRSKSAV